MRRGWRVQLGGPSSREKPEGRWSKNHVASILVPTLQILPPLAIYRMMTTDAAAYAYAPDVMGGCSSGPLPIDLSRLDV